MPLPDQVTPQEHVKPQEAPASTTRIVITKVFVRGLEVDAAIGVYKHEKGRLQRLVLDVELDVAVTDWSDLSETVNYEVIATKARAVAAEGHRGLVETFCPPSRGGLLQEPKVTAGADPGGEALCAGPGREGGRRGDHRGAGLGARGRCTIGERPPSDSVVTGSATTAGVASAPLPLAERGWGWGCQLERERSTQASARKAQRVGFGAT